MKKKIILAVSIAALFIPTVIAIIYYISVQNQPLSASNTNKLTLSYESTVNNKTLSKTFDKTAKDPAEKEQAEKWIEFFLGMNEASSKISELPANIKQRTAYSATFTSYNKDKEYKYFFSPDPNEAYFVDNNSGVYKIPLEKAAEFINSEYGGEYLFSNSKIPVLKLADGTVVEPKYVSWYYKNASNGWNKSSVEGSGTESETVQIAKQLSTDFNVMPDSVKVRISQDGEQIYDGLIDNLLPSVIGEKTATLAVEITASWNGDQSRDFYGELSYSFQAEVTAPAEFYLGKTEIQHGEVVAISARNVRSAGDIEFKSEPDLGFTPSFFKFNDYYVALVPISLDTEYVEQYTFTLTVKGVSQTLQLNVKVRDNFKNIDKLVSNDVTLEVLNRTKNTATLDAFKNAVKKASEENDPLIYYAGVFMEPINGLKIRSGYGRKVIVTATGETYLNHGVDSVPGYNGSSVLAPNAGKVVFAGETVFSGKLIIIDHGLGLKSWFMHLGDVNVSVGDTVEKGQAIGTVGSSGFCAPGALHYLYTVNNVPVSPYLLEEKGIEIFFVE